MDEKPTGQTMQLGASSTPVGERERTTMTRDVTMLELVTDLSNSARTEAEVIATVVHLVNSGAVRLCGNFRGARLALDGMPPASGLAA